MSALRIPRYVAASITLASWMLLCTTAQDLKYRRDQAQIIAEHAADDITKHYYDPKLHGLDWGAKLDEAKKKIENATSSNLAFANIAAMLDALNDSHTFFIPPTRSFSIDYGWRIEAIGEHCLVTHVRPETDAATKVHVGDEVLAINDYKPSRANLDRISYVLDVLRPQSKIEATVRSQSGEIRHLEIVSKVFPGQLVWTSTGEWQKFFEVEHDRLRPRIVSLSSDVLVVRIPSFRFLTPGDIGKVVSEARKHKALILDLRGNPGGAVESLKMLVGGIFDHDVKIADAATRGDTKPLIAKSDRHNFSGRLTVLVDNSSRSGAEIFARVVQLEKRGVILGDRTAGMVMESQVYRHGVASVLFGVSVTIAALTMSDGESLEHVGVNPDETVLPTVDDITSMRDPVLARAAELAGAKLSPTDAARLFPFEWETPFIFSGN